MRNIKYTACLLYLLSFGGANAQLTHFGKEYLKNSSIEDKVKSADAVVE